MTHIQEIVEVVTAVGPVEVVDVGVLPATVEKRRSQIQ